jgi:hypothetical protein
VPGGAPLPFSDTVRVAGVVPLEVTISRPSDCAAGVAVMFNAPLELVIDTVCAAGDDPPTVSVKESEAGEALMVIAPDAMTVSVTGTDIGLFGAPAAVMFTDPV